MARKKKFNDQAGFLWNTDDIHKVQQLADAKDLTPSDIYREAMRIYFDIAEGRANIQYVPQAAQSTQAVTSTQATPDEKPSEQETQPAATTPA